MRDGFVKVAAGTPKIRVADCDYNAGQIIALMREAAAQGVKVLALPELCVTGYTCGDLFLQPTLLDGAERALGRILEETRELDMLTALGMPVRNEDHKLYNCAAVLLRGELLGLVPKSHIPNYGEFYEGRWFASGRTCNEAVRLCGGWVDLSPRRLFSCSALRELTVGIEICEDLWAAASPAAALAQAGATLMLNLSASDEVAGKADYRRSLVTGQSARCLCAYVYANAGEGESSTDLVFAGHNMIAENGALLAEMSLEEKAGQLFFMKLPDVEAEEKVRDLHVGGVLLFTKDFKDAAGEWLSREAFEEKIQALQAAAGTPLLVGVGVATSVETAALLSKKALMRPLGSHNPNERAAEMERLLEDGINAIGLGPQGMSGNCSVMGVHIENTARHPSTIGVAVNVGCWSHRRGHVIFDRGLNATVTTHSGVLL